MSHHRHNRKHHSGRNRHHFLQAKSRGGHSTPQNLLLIDIEKHEAWHRLFKLMSAEEVLDLLTRVVEAKKHQKGGHN